MSVNGHVRRAPLRRLRPAVGGIVTPLVCAGPADAAEAVVFVHGSPGSGEDWADLVGRVGVHARAVAPSMPGFGRAEKPKSFDYGVAGYTAHLDLTLTELGIERAHLVLHDFGGLWRLTWAAANPDRIAGLTLVNTGVMVGYRWHALAAVWQTPLVGELVMAMTSLPVFRALLNRGTPRPLPGEFVERTYEEFDARTRDAVLRLYRSTPDLGRASIRLGRLLAAHRYPVLVIWGAHDPYLPVRYARFQQEVFPDARISVFPSSGHWPFVDDPEGVADTLVPFIGRTMGSADRAGP